MRPQAHIQAQAEDRVLQRRTTLRDEPDFRLGFELRLRWDSDRIARALVVRSITE
jgi:hypothetical protein